MNNSDASPRDVPLLSDVPSQPTRSAKTFTLARPAPKDGGFDPRAVTAKRVLAADEFDRRRKAVARWRGENPT